MTNNFSIAYASSSPHLVDENDCASASASNIDSLTSRASRAAVRATEAFAKICSTADALPPCSTSKPFISTKSAMLRDDVQLKPFVVLGGVFHVVSGIRFPCRGDRAPSFGCRGVTS